jgi:starch-binding outer membrane protein, SusD/RagB family
MRKDTHGGWRRRSPLLSMTLAAAVVSLAACDYDSLLEVEDPDVTLSEDLFDPANLPALRASAWGDFTAAYSGTSSTATPGLTHASGLLGDELWFSGTFGQNREMDGRSISESNGFVQGLARNLYRARRIAVLGFEGFALHEPNSTAQAEMANLEGYIYVFFAESFCSGVPISNVVDGRFEYGSGDTTEELYQRALDAFATALNIATASGSTDQAFLARIGSARAQLGLNNYAAAAGLVAGIPTSFVIQVEHSNNTGRQNNGLWANNHGRLEISVANLEGGNGVNYRRGTAPAPETVVTTDPRVPWSYRAGSAAGTTMLHYRQHKYGTQGSPTNLASGVEARLIEAEATLNRGASAAYLPIINALRAPLGLPDLTDPGTAAARVDQFFSERAMFLFGTANRLSDMRRLIRQYDRDSETVFATGDFLRPLVDGSFRDEGVYGPDVNLPVTIDEQNNPLSGQCFDREA